MSAQPRSERASESEKTAVKPRRLRRGDKVAVISPASPAEPAKLSAGMAELKRLGFEVSAPPAARTEGYFAGTTDQRHREICAALEDPQTKGLIAVRGGYGSNYLLEEFPLAKRQNPVCMIGYSDLTSIQMFLWQRLGWVSFYGPMVAAGLDAGAGKPGGYDEVAFLRAIGETGSGWGLDLRGESMVSGEAEGTLLGGCLTMLQTSIGTPWQLDASQGILVLEDRGMKPWQVDRAVKHLLQAGLLAGVRGIVLGEFPECEPGVAGSWSVADVFRRMLKPLGIPVVWGAPVGHAKRPMLSVPLGVRARLRAQGAGALDILEPAVVE